MPMGVRWAPAVAQALTSAICGPPKSEDVYDRKCTAIGKKDEIAVTFAKEDVKGWIEAFVVIEEKAVSDEETIKRLRIIIWTRAINERLKQIRGLSHRGLLEPGERRVRGRP